jgi:hypothetical protein
MPSSIGSILYTFKNNFNHNEYYKTRKVKICVKFAKSVMETCEIVLVINKARNYRHLHICLESAY